ncbi:MAG: hypothetical protein PUG78_10505 [Eubacteriales bacterium]|nr:hypothetical protein [Eubacteriales bacterium]MDY2933594.1 hypothetical protein [Anaerovoracaceae bacterium]MEE0180394.1 hypothetical protein [Anaerovoracaceae bacterium]
MVALIEVLGIIAVQIAVLYFIVKLAVKKALKEYDEDRNKEPGRD